MAAKSRIVKWQKVREIKTKKNFNGESSPYWQFVDNNNRSNPKREGDQENSEYPTANPDVLPELDAPEENLTRKIILRDWREIKFTPKEKQILALVARGVSQTDIAKQLKVTQSRVAHAIARIQKKAAKWYDKKFTKSDAIVREEENEH